MAKVVLDRHWLHDAENLASHIACWAETPAVKETVDGEVRKYASGRMRTIVRAGQARTVDLTVFDLSDADYQLLRSWLGKVVMWRDIRGRLIFGSFFSVKPEDYPDGDGWIVSFTLHEVTRSVEV